jgi:hypothetical protein
VAPRSNNLLDTQRVSLASIRGSHPGK